MVKLAGPLVPNFLNKVLFHEPLNAHKFVYFVWNLGRLWTLRTIFSEQRRRYKHLFSELHHLAAALLRGMRLEDVRAMYRESLCRTQGLWFDGAVELLRRVTRSAVVVLVTGSEQLQTEECVRLLADWGVDTERIFVHGSLYGYDRSTGRFTGQVQQLNVTLEGKRDVVRRYAEDPTCRIAGAIGNSRPDRALFEVVEPAGVRILVCPETVFRKRKETSFVVRKLARSGFQVYWEPQQFLLAAGEHAESGDCTPIPVLATDSTFANVLTSQALWEVYPHLAERAESRAVHVEYPDRVPNHRASPGATSPYWDKSAAESSEVNTTPTKP
jgi:phosphoserine phosphatase